MFKKLVNFLKRLFLRKKFPELRKVVKSTIWREKNPLSDCSYNDYLQRSF